MRDFDLSFGAMVGLAAGAAVVLMANDGWSWPMALDRRAPLRHRGRGRQRVPRRLPGRELVHHDAGDGHGPDRRGVRVDGPEDDLQRGRPGLRRHRRRTRSSGLNNRSGSRPWSRSILWALLDRTEVGRYMYAIGGNPEAARLAGIRTRFLRLLGFVVVGLAAADGRRPDQLAVGRVHARSPGLSTCCRPSPPRSSGRRSSGRASSTSRARSSGCCSSA